ncbi:DUF1610 domain-containing protein [Candidatus Woesearchaeota archaeon]|nr:DUF1610 domain-containing protein [Candidatus Woesearchaeota archaeon]
MEKSTICTSCKKQITNTQGAVRFLCPNCSKVEIVRCRHCREIAARYTCTGCNFSGPN